MHSRQRAYLAWVMVCVVWGTTYLAIRISIETIPALLMAGLRWVTAGALLIGILSARGEPLPERRSWPSLAVLGVLLIGLGNGAVVWAEQTVPSGITAFLVATTPFWLVGIDATLSDGDALTPRRVFGLIVGFCGIVLLVWPDIRGVSGGGFFGGVMASQIASAGWALGSGYARRRAHEENVLAAAAFEMLFGGTALLVVGLLLNEGPALAFNARTTGAFVYLIVFGSIGGFSAYAYALKHLPIATVSLYSYINPLIAVILGTAILNEAFSARTMVAATVVLVGIVIVRGGRTDDVTPLDAR